MMIKQFDDIRIWISKITVLVYSKPDITSM